MSNVPILNLPPIIALAGGEWMEAVQNGASGRLQTAQLAAVGAALTSPGVGVYQSWTPTITPDTGTFNTVTVSNANWAQVGSIVAFQATFEIVDPGSGAGDINLTLPTVPAFSFSAIGRSNTVNAAMIWAYFAAAATFKGTFYNGTTPITGPTIFYNVSGVYQTT